MPLRVDTTGSMPTLYLYDLIADNSWNDNHISDVAVLDALAAHASAEKINVRINSPGGDVFMGIAIYNALARFPGQVIVDVDALAASIASIIALAGRPLRMAKNAQLMIHRAWTFAMGNAKDLTKIAGTLEQVDGILADTYQEKTEQTREQIVSWLDEETWFTAEAAKAAGFIDEITGTSQVSARLRAGQFKNAPKELLAPTHKPQPKLIPAVGSAAESLATPAGTLAIAAANVRLARMRAGLR